VLSGRGLSVVSFVCCQVEVSATSRSLVRRSPTECGVSERDLANSTKRRPWTTRAVESRKVNWDCSAIKYGLFLPE
jgi:hypothetical protein